ncbi:MAG: phenylalanine--tRNA ligase subunit beta [archaeon]|nr:phenylalanine--tRNA ligase subunit beta [archaeon]
MAGVKFSRKEFEKHFKLTDELKEKISLFGTHFEGISEDGNEIELEITPNRPDLYSLHGFIRAFSAFLGKSKGLKEYKLNKPEKNFEVKIDSSVRDVRPFTACAIVKDLKFDNEKIKEIINIQEKIHNTLGRNRKKIAIGIYPLEKITLPIKLEARKPTDIKFMPLEMDREMNGLQILQSHPTGREYANLLEGKDKFPIFVDAKGEILSMPPIINSHKTGKITETTKDIFIECSGFDFDILKKTLNILVTMLAEMNGKIYQMELSYGSKKELTPNLTPEKMKISVENVNKLLGLELKENEIGKLLEKMGHNYDKGIVSVASWRTDVMHEVDLIEDIAIGYGYDNFKPELPSIATTGEIDKTEVLKKRIAEILSGLNMLEISNYHLLTLEESKNVGLKEKEIIEVEDSKSEWKILRPNLLSLILNSLKKNLDAEYPQRIFELGKVFEKDNTGKSETGIKETEKLAVAIASSNAGFTEIKQVLEYLLRMLGKYQDVLIESEDIPNFLDGRGAKITLNNKVLGFFGELKPQMLSNLGIKMPVGILEINVEELL